MSCSNRIVPLFLLSAAIGALLLAGCERPPEPVAATLVGETMGTRYTIRLAEHSDDLPLDLLQAAVDETLERLNDQMSTYRPDSEISRFNAADSTDWFPVSAATAKVIAAAQKVSHESDGAFDVTVMPLVNLWTFGPENRRDVIPSDGDIAERRRHVGFDKLDVRLDPPALKKTDPRVAVDLSAIAKGYGVDLLAELLEARGLRDYMVEIGGEVRTGGHKRDGSAWRIGIERPAANERSLETVVELSDDAMATSGDYRNFFERDGVRYSHIVDPRTARPIDHTLVSVSVLSKDCITADAFTTTVMVLGPAEGYNWLVERETPALLIVKVGDRFVEKPTPAWKRRFNRSASGHS